MLIGVGVGTGEVLPSVDWDALAARVGSLLGLCNTDEAQQNPWA